MNLTDGGEGSPGKIVSWDTREKQRKSMTGKSHTEKTKEKMRNSHKGWVPPEGFGEAISQRMQDFKHTEETKNLLSQKASERYKDPENNPMYGKTQSEETLKLMRESHKNRPILKCPYCKKDFTSAMYKRWHGEKCKEKGRN